jgi:hypothetical protein
LVGLPPIQTGAEGLLFDDSLRPVDGEQVPIPDLIAFEP